MAILQIPVDQIKRCWHSYNGLGSSAYIWSGSGLGDVTNDADTTLAHYHDSDPSTYSDNYLLQFRIPANALSGLDINSVKFYMRCISLNRTCPLYVRADDVDELISGTSVSDSLTASGWSDTDITARFNANVANKDGVWYVNVSIAYAGIISDDTQYTAYINTLNGDYDPYVEIDYTADACTAPTLDALPSVAETDPTLSGSGASGDQYGNEIVGYEIQYAESADGETWGEWAAEKTVNTSESYFSTSVVISPTRGNYMKWRVRTLGEAGEDYYSDWVESGAVRRNSVPSAPSSVSASPSIYEDGGIKITWPATADTDNNVAAYELQRASSSDGSTWDDWADVDTNISVLYYIDSPMIARGEYVKYRIRAKDTFGITSGYIETASVHRNQITAPATINYPQASQTIYNPRPRLLVTLGTEPDEQLQTLTATGYTASSSGPYESGKKLMLRRTSAVDAGTVSATITPKDSQEVEGASASVDTTYAVPSWTDDIIAGATRIKAVHINELRNAIDVVRSYYGLSEYDWPETIIAGKTSMRGWAGHLTELRSAIDAVITLVNGWDSAAQSNKITQPAWATLGTWPQASLLTQIRTVITQL